MKRLALFVIGLYRRWLSPALPPSCRFVPSCSAYATTAIERYGFWRGGWLATKRLARCHPLCEGGHDPVPCLHAPPSPSCKPDEPSHA